MIKIIAALIVGLAAGSCFSTYAVQHDAIKNHVAHYDSYTGVIKWGAVPCDMCVDERALMPPEVKGKK